MSTQTSSKTTRCVDPIRQEKVIRQAPDAKQNNSSANDAAYAMQICRRFLMLLGVWLPVDAGFLSWRVILGNIAVIVIYFGAGIRSIPTVFYIIIDEKIPLEKLKLVVRCMFVTVNATKYTMLRSHREDIEKCMKHIEQDWLKLETPASREIMLEQARFGHLITRICAAITYTGATFLSALPIVVGGILADKAQQMNATETAAVRRFAVSSHFGHPLFSQTPIFEFIWSSQVIATFLMHSVAMTCFSLAVVIVMHACGQLRILMGKLNELVDGGGEMSVHDSVEGRMADIVRHHVRALSFVSSAEKMLRGIYLVDLGGCVLQLCCLGYFTLAELRADVNHPVAICAYATLFLTFVFNIFSVCYIGELLTQGCMKVGETSYMIDWHRLPGKQSLDLGLVITMSQSPVTLTAGGAIQFSFICFTSVIKTAMGYLNMLRTVMD